MSTLSLPQEQYNKLAPIANDTIRLGALVLVLVFGAILMVAPDAAGGILIASLVAALLVASWIDTWTRLIPNRLTYTLVLLGVGGNLTMSVFASDEVAGVVGIEESLKGSALCFSLMLLLFLSNATGGGDVKLATAIGAFLGPQVGIMAIAWCHVLAGTFVVLWMLCLIDPFRLVRNLCSYALGCWVSGRLQPISWTGNSLAQKRIPMAAFFALGVLFTLLGLRLW